jgi:mono/diheme cytochrome c family protein
VTTARLVLVAAALAGCDGLLPGPDFERMIDQQKGKPYGASPLLPDGKIMQPPPGGTLMYAGPEERAQAAHPELSSGVDASGDYLSSVPVPVDRPLLERGQDRFDVICAACHGLLGDGQSEVARHMEQRRPPSLLDERVRAFPAGRIFRVIGSGYGLMPSYAWALAARDRWAVVAYLRALEMSQMVRLDDLGPSARRQAEAALR